MVGKVSRILRHLLTPAWLATRHFTPDILDAIEAAIIDSETRHRGEIRFAVESEIELAALLRGDTPHDRAVEAFGHLGVWDTEENSGILVFVQLVDRSVEVVVDRGVAHCVDPAFWREVAAAMEEAYAAGEYLDGSLEGIARIDAVLQQHFPAYPRNPNELPDRPMLI